MPTLQVAIDARKAKQGAEEYSKASKKVKTSATQAEKATKGLSTGLDKLGTSGIGAKKVLAGVFTGLAALAVARDITKTVASFGATMSTLEAVTGATEGTLARLEATARELGASTKFSATEAGEGLVFLARAGLEADEAIAAIPSTLHLAAAGAIGLGDAADYASNIMSQFNLQAAEMARVTDVLVTTSNSANTNVQQLAEALKFVGPIAGTLGVSLEQTSAALGVLGDRGIQASLAGTNLRGVFANLLGPSGAAEKAIKSLGLSLEDVNPEKYDLITIFKRFEEANLGAGEALEIFGKRNISAALTMEASIDRMEQLTIKNKEMTGSSREAAEIMANNLAGSLKALRSAVEEAYLATGDAGFTGGLKGIVDTSTGAIRSLAGVEGAAEDASFASMTLASSIKLATVAFAAFIALKIAAVIGAIVTKVGSLTAGFVALRAVLNRHPIMAIATVATAAAVAFVAFSSNVRAATKAAQGLSDITADLTATTENFANAQAKLNRGMEQESIKTQSDAIREMIALLESAQDQIRKTFEEGQTIGVKGSSLEQFGITTQDLMDNLGALSFETREALINMSEGGRIALLSYNDALAIVEEKTEDLKDKAVELGINLSTGVEDDIEARVNQAIAVREAADALDEAIDKIKDEQTALKLSDEERDKYLTKKELEKSLDNLSAAEKEKYLQTIDDEISKLHQLQREQEEHTRKLEESNDAFEEKREASIILQEYIDNIKDEISAIRGEGDLIELTNASLHVRNLAFQAGKDDIQAYDKQVRELIKTLQDSREERERQLAVEREVSKVADQMERANRFLVEAEEDLEFQIQQTTRSYEDQRRAAALKDVGAAAKDAGISAEEATSRTNALFDELERAEMIKDVADGMAEAFGSAFEGILTGSMSGKEALASFIVELQRMMIQLLIIKPLMQGISGGISGILTPSEYGNVFMNGNIVPFQAGGVVADPQLFYMRDGRLGSIAEKEPEAIMPLKRGAGGRLGVEASGAGGGAVTQNVTNVNMKIITNDADSFKRSRSQITNDLKRRAGN
jgi:TP901 family phage tail tape measure protein